MISIENIINKSKEERKKFLEKSIGKSELIGVIDIAKMSLSENTIPNSLSELESKFSSLTDFEGLSEEFIQSIGKEMIRLTTEWQGRNINTLNK